MVLPISMLLTCGLSILLLTLSISIIKQRYVVGSSIGDSGDGPLLRKIRAQGNLIEYAPLFVVLIALAELNNGHAVIIGAIALTFMVGRVLHGYALAFTDKNRKARVSGIALTVISITCAILFDLSLFI